MSSRSRYLVGYGVSACQARSVGEALRWQLTSLGPSLALIAVALILTIQAEPWRQLSATDITLTADGSSAEAGSASSPTASPEAGQADWPSDPQAAATEACNARLSRYQGADNSWNATLAAAYPVRSEDVAAEDERIRGASHQSPFRADAPGTFLTLCYFDGEAFGIVRRAGEDPPPSAHNRLKEIVRPDGTPYVLVAGRRESIQPDPLPRAGSR